MTQILTCRHQRQKWLASGNKKQPFHTGSWSKPLFNDPLGADFHTPPAVQTVVLLDDHRLLRNVNAFLRTDGVAQLAANTAFAHIVAWYILHSLANGEAVPDNMSRIADVKILAVRFIQAEYI